MTWNTLKHLTFAGAFCAALAYAAGSSAAIMYGDFSDIPPGVVMYTDVTESSSTDPVPPALYGAPDAVGNELDFDPTAFGASATNGSPSADLTDGQLNFGFMTLPGTGLSNLLLSESGDFTLFGTGTSTTSVAAGLFAEVEITHINEVMLATPITVIGSTQFTTDLISSPGLNQPWAQSLFIDFAPALINAGFDPQVDFATKGEVVINDTLAAIAEPDPATIAFIAKKDFKVIPGGDFDRNEIPEPATALLGMIALVGLAARRA